jgi:hypothetical protein
LISSWRAKEGRQTGRQKVKKAGRTGRKEGRKKVQEGRKLANHPFQQPIF